MYVKILYDSEAEKGLIGDWGFSCLVGDETLFDTGSNADILRHNLRQLGVNLEAIKRVFISHHHYDHVGGIEILRDLGDVEVFIPSDIPDELMSKLTVMGNVTLKNVPGPTEIAPGLFSTGEIECETKEQVLVVRTDKGVTMISGCLHKGVGKGLEVAYMLGKVYALIGGLHDLQDQQIEGMSLIVPCHCTKGQMAVKKAHPDLVRKCKVGLVVEI
jgi:7,8-dihydropterin-6-yl-methyl-4-(beta-D-ribofuranosyl)aminobenzene 5'-phosphate synthase